MLSSTRMRCTTSTVAQRATIADRCPTALARHWPGTGMALARTGDSATNAVFRFGGVSRAITHWRAHASPRLTFHPAAPVSPRTAPLCCAVRKPRRRVSGVSGCARLSARRGVVCLCVPCLPCEERSRVDRRISIGPRRIAADDLHPSATTACKMQRFNIPCRPGRPAGGWIER